MKSVILLVSGLLCGLALASAQNKTGADGNPVAVDVTAEPHHDLVLENEYVRVFEVNVPPMKQTLWYQHRYDFIEVALSDSHHRDREAGARFLECPKRTLSRAGALSAWPLHIQDGEQGQLGLVSEYHAGSEEEQ
jgi:hypothetical protein